MCLYQNLGDEFLAVLLGCPYVRGSDGKLAHISLEHSLQLGGLGKRHGKLVCQSRRQCFRKYRVEVARVCYSRYANYVEQIGIGKDLVSLNAPSSVHLEILVIRNDNAKAVSRHLEIITIIKQRLSHKRSKLILFSGKTPKMGAQKTVPDGRIKYRAKAGGLYILVSQ